MKKNRLLFFFFTPGSRSLSPFSEHVGTIVCLLLHMNCPTREKTIVKEVQKIEEKYLLYYHGYLKICGCVEGNVFHQDLRQLSN